MLMTVIAKDVSNKIAYQLIPSVFETPAIGRTSDIGQNVASKRCLKLISIVQIYFYGNQNLLNHS